MSKFLRAYVFRCLAAVVMVFAVSSQLIVISGHGIGMRQPHGHGAVQKVNEPLMAATSRFAFKLYNQLQKQGTNKNVFVSPSSVILALAMTYNGAEGKTRHAMARTLEIEGLSLSEVNNGFAELQRAAGDADPKVQLKIANSLWARQGFTLKPEFVERSKQNYSAEVTTLDFNSPAAPMTINSWVKNKTDNLIDSIVDRIDSNNILFLINAIYFKGQWKNEFEKAKTKDEDFQLPNGQQKKVPMMAQSGQYRYLRGEDFQAVTLSYGNGRINMYVFLPDKGKNLEDFEKKVTFENWEAWIKSLRFEPGTVMLPRFKVEYQTDLNEVLKALGMAEAFDANVADFSGIAATNSGARLYISEVKHKAFAEVNEEGTKAAAVTSVGVAVTSVQIPREPFMMKVDRPFFFAIRDDTIGAVLFMGSIVDPK
jgi:serine protease inhibitor